MNTLHDSIFNLYESEINIKIFLLLLFFQGDNITTFKNISFCVECGSECKARHQCFIAKETLAGNYKVIRTFKLLMVEKQDDINMHIRIKMITLITSSDLETLVDSDVYFC